MSPRTREQNEEIRRQRKQEILQAAIAVYAEKGYAASDMGEIAERAGLAHGLVFYYFKNKKTLFRELYTYMREESRRATEAYFEQDVPALELLGGYARTVCERVLDRPDISRFYARIGLDLPHLYAPDEIAPFDWVKSFMEPMARTVERGIAEGAIPPGDAQLMAMQFWGAVSQGMTYLDQTLQRLAAREDAGTAPEDRLDAVLDQVVSSALSLLRQG